MLVARDEVELYNLICEWGFVIPTVSPTPGQQAPFEALCDLYFDRARRAIVMAARGNGKSLLLALLAVLLSLKEPGTVALAFGQVERQSSVILGYVGQLARLPQLRDYFSEVLQTRVTFHNGSKVVLSSAGAGSSTIAVHGHLLLLDELDTFETDLLQNVLLCLSGDEQHPGRIVGASTRYGSDGMLDRLIADGSWSVYSSDFWTSLQPCPECIGPDCPLFTWQTPKGIEPFCQGRALWSTGFRPLDDVLNLYRAASLETWRVQQMIFDPQGAGRIWRNFDPDVHIGHRATDLSLRDRLEAVAGIFETEVRGGPVIVGLDWGLSPAIVVVRKIDGVLWVVEEMGGEGVRLEDMRLYLLDLKSRHGDFAIWCGAHDQLTSPMQARWSEDDLSLIPVSGQFDFRGVRHDEIRKMLDPDPATGQPRLMFDEACARTIRQVRLAKVSDEQNRRRGGDDFRDALGYAVAGYALSGGEAMPGGALVM